MGSSPHQQGSEPAGISSANWITQQTQEGSDPISSVLQSFRICSKTPDDSLSFVPGSSLDNKWEQYFIYAQVINSKAEEAADESYFHKESDGLEKSIFTPSLLLDGEF